MSDPTQRDEHRRQWSCSGVWKMESGRQGPCRHQHLATTERAFLTNWHIGFVSLVGDQGAPKPQNFDQQFGH